MRWRRSMLVVSSSSRHAFLAAGLATANLDGTHLAETVRWARVTADPRTAAALSAVLRRFEEQGVRNADERQKEVQGGARNAAMAAAAGPRLPLLAQWRRFLLLLALSMRPLHSYCLSGTWDRSARSPVLGSRARACIQMYLHSMFFNCSLKKKEIKIKIELEIDLGYMTLYLYLQWLHCVHPHIKLRSYTQILHTYSTKLAEDNVVFSSQRRVACASRTFLCFSDDSDFGRLFVFCSSSDAEAVTFVLYFASITKMETPLFLK